MSRPKNAANAAEPTATADQMTNEATEKRVPATSSKRGTPVPSSELLQIVSKLEGSPPDQIAHACGYYTEITTIATGDVEFRVTTADMFAFMQAILAAQGTKIAIPVRSHRRTNRAQVIKIGKTGNIVVGGRYTTIAGFPFGENVESRVRVEAEKGKITIFAASPSDHPAPNSDIADDLDIEEEDSEIDE